DAARFAGNAWLVTQREPEFRDWSPREVAEAAFRLANGCVGSMKKDGLVNIGGFVALRDEELARRCGLLLIATEGFPTYGGLAGRDLDVLAQGLVEVTDLNALRLLPHLPAYRFPGHALASELYLEGGIRSAELRSLHLGEGD